MWIKNILPESLILLVGLSIYPVIAQETDKKEILETIQFLSAHETRQEVKINVEFLNLDNDWAVLVGELVTPSGKELDWSKVDICDATLDHGLWAVLKKENGQWQIEQHEICTTEPPYWYIEEDIGLIWPCGVYKDLRSSENETLEQRCREQKAK